MSDSDLSALRAQYDALAKPTLKKVQQATREALKEKSRSAFSQAFVACGMTQGELADFLGIRKSYVNDMLHGRRDVPDWVLRGMPRSGRLVVARDYLEGVEREPPSRVSWG
jgi:DNA-binding XRE family transcriptional regulator